MRDKSIDCAVEWVEFAFESGGGEINRKIVGESPEAEADQDQQQEDGQNADEAVDEEEAVADAPKRMPLDETESAEGDKGTQRHQNEQREESLNHAPRKVKRQIQRQIREERDARLAETPQRLGETQTSPRHYRGLGNERRIDSRN